SRRRAASTRTVSTKRAGVVPTSRRNTRAKLRGLIATRRASTGTDRSASGCSATQACNSRTGSRSVAWVASRALNCDWPPGRRGERRRGARGAERPRAAETPRDQRRREAHARRHAGGGPDVAVAHEDRIGLDRDLGEHRRERGARGPVGGDPPTFEEAGGG